MGVQHDVALYVYLCTLKKLLPTNMAIAVDDFPSGPGSLSGGLLVYFLLSLFLIRGR